MNYKADGTPFWNQFFVAALRDENEEVSDGNMVTFVLRWRMLTCLLCPAICP